jgi:hypothetical protein
MGYKFNEITNQFEFVDDVSINVDEQTQDYLDETQINVLNNIVPKLNTEQKVDMINRVQIKDVDPEDDDDDGQADANIMASMSQMQYEQAGTPKTEDFYPDLPKADILAGQFAGKYIGTVPHYVPRGGVFPLGMLENRRTKLSRAAQRAAKKKEKILEDIGVDTYDRFEVPLNNEIFAEIRAAAVSFGGVYEAFTSGTPASLDLLQRLQNLTTKGTFMSTIETQAKDINENLNKTDVYYPEPIIKEVKRYLGGANQYEYKEMTIEKLADLQSMLQGYQNFVPVANTMLSGITPEQSPIADYLNEDGTIDFDALDADLLAGDIVAHKANSDLYALITAKGDENFKALVSAGAKFINKSQLTNMEAVIAANTQLYKGDGTKKEDGGSGTEEEWMTHYMDYIKSMYGKQIVAKTQITPDRIKLMAEQAKFKKDPAEKGSFYFDMQARGVDHFGDNTDKTKTMSKIFAGTPPYATGSKRQLAVKDMLGKVMGSDVGGKLQKHKIEDGTDGVDLDGNEKSYWSGKQVITDEAKNTSRFKVPISETQYIEREIIKDGKAIKQHITVDEWRRLLIKAKNDITKIGTGTKTQVNIGGVTVEAIVGGTILPISGTDVTKMSVDYLTPYENAMVQGYGQKGNGVFVQYYGVGEKVFNLRATGEKYAAGVNVGDGRGWKLLYNDDIENKTYMTNKDATYSGVVVQEYTAGYDDTKEVTDVAQLQQLIKNTYTDKGVAVLDIKDVEALGGKTKHIHVQQNYTRNDTKAHDTRDRKTNAQQIIIGGKTLNIMPVTGGGDIKVKTSEDDDDYSGND